MCVTEVKILFDQLSSLDAKTRIESVQEIYDIYQKNVQLQESILNELAKGLATIRPQPRQGFTNTFCHLLRTLDANAFETTIRKINQCLFLTDVKSSTKSELTASKLGSILAFDALVISKRANEIQKETLNNFLSFVMNLLDDNTFGYISAEVISNYFKTLSKSAFEKMKSLIKKEILQADILERCPQMLILWIGFSTEQKKVLKINKKPVPSLQNDDILSKLPSLMKNMKGEHLLLIFNHIVISTFFPLLWTRLAASWLRGDSDLKEKQMILNMGFEVIRPHKTSLISKLESEKRKQLIDLIWGNELFMNLFYKQLSSPEYDLYQTCSNFVKSIHKVENATEKNFLEHVFNHIMNLSDKNMTQEVKTSQSIRFSHNLLRYVEDINTCNKYVDILKIFFDRSVSDQEKIYVLEQLTSLYTKAPQNIITFLIKVNILYNHSDDIVNNRVSSSAKAALFRCLESIQITDLDHLKSLLMYSETILNKNSVIRNTIQCVLKNWNSDALKSKKRSASERDKIVVDFQNCTDSMFVALQSHICLYILCQPLEQEILNILNDVVSCMSEMKGSSPIDEHCHKKIRSSTSNTVILPEKTWKLVLTDILTLFMEQSCHYLRRLSVTIFKIFVSEGHCDNSVVKLLQSTIVEIEVEINGVDKKKHDSKNEDITSVESENEYDSDDNESDSNGDKSDSNGDNTDKDIEDIVKARIQAALGAMQVDVDSDADDNCPDEVSDISSEDDEKDNVKSLDKKITLKDIRFKILQLREYRNRCIDLLDIVILNSPSLTIRVDGLLVFLEQFHKNDNEMEIHLLKTISTFKLKSQNKEEISSAEVVANINLVIAAVQKCRPTKNVVTAFSDIMVSLLKMRKSDIVNIVCELKDIIELCIKDKNSHPMKAVFLTMFDKFPEIAWAFHTQVVNYVGEEQPKLVQYRAFEVLRKVMQNLEIKALVKGRNVAQSFLSSDDICLFVVNFAERLNRTIANLDLQNNPKHSSIVVGSLIDCLKLCPVEALKVIEVTTVNKIKVLIKLPKAEIPKELKRTINQFVAALSLAQSQS